MSRRSMVAMLRALWRLNLAEELQYRSNFVASLLGTLFWLSMALLTLGLFFRQTDSLGGWGFWEVMVLLGVFNTLAGIVDALLRPSIGRIVEDVRTGNLDLILARPVDTQFYVSFRRLDVWRLTDVVLGLGLAGFAAAHLDPAPSPASVIAFLVALAAASVVVYALWIVLMSLAFWFVAVENLAVLFDSIFEAARYPVSAYPGALRILFVYLVPIAWTTTVPASAMTGRLPGSATLVAAAVAGISLMLARVFWRTALRRYTSAGG